MISVETMHCMHFQNAQAMTPLGDRTVDLVVTSPPYPMIEMWDEVFCKADPAIAKALSRCKGAQAFALMHAQLDRVWQEVARVLKPGGIACINIGDATRTLGDDFQLFANHAHVVNAFLSLGLSQLPAILWRKPTNSPNKFMGSGMLPPNAYVTLEHEYILIFRNQGLRRFDTEEDKELRRSSAYFWEERNLWFSDVWFGLIGATQELNNRQLRARSGAYPFELPHRLIHMFSIKGDTVLDPFLGTGTTLHAAMGAGRNSVGFEIDPAFEPFIVDKISSVAKISRQTTQRRCEAHRNFIQERIKLNKTVKHHNPWHNFPVITNQEKKLRLDIVQEIESLSGNRFKVSYVPWQEQASGEPIPPLNRKEPDSSKALSGNQQLELF